MSDDETTKKPKVFLAKPPKKVNEMTEDEMYAWAHQLSERLKPDEGRRTQVSDDVAELNAGKITVQQLGERWAARTWLPIHPRLTDPVGIAALEACDGFGPDGSWSEVDNLFAKGVLSRADYFAVSKVIDEEKSKG